MEFTFEQDGVNYVVRDGDLYRVPDAFVGHVYDPNFYAANYREVNGAIEQVDPKSGQWYSILRTFQSGFSSPLTAPSRWHTTVRTVPENTVSLVSGTLRCRAVPHASIVSKANVNRGLLFFREGDTVYTRARFFIESVASLYDGGGTTLMDLESQWLTGSPGIRIIVRSQGELCMELELPKTQFRQDTPVAFPLGRWVEVNTALLLSATVGRVQLWQDGQLVLDKPGRTLPFSDTIYDKFEVGLTAMAAGSTYPKVVRVDDVRISDTP